MRVLKPRGELDLASETLGRDTRRELRRQELDHHRASERALGCHVDSRHPAAAELSLDGVGRAQRRLKGLAERVAHWTSGEDERAGVGEPTGEGTIGT
jgi:hypothetical protein